MFFLSESLHNFAAQDLIFNKTKYPLIGITFFIMSKADSITIDSKKQKQFDKRYLEMALVWSHNSYCKRRRVGALLVKNKMIISDGYNGTPSGFVNNCEDPENTTYPYVLHAEANAITKVAKSNNSSEGATLYVTTSPCMECSKLIIQAGISRVVYSFEYHTTDGLELLRKANIVVEYLKID